MSKPVHKKAHWETGAPQWVHEAMERHYLTAHRGDLDQTLGVWR